MSFGELLIENALDSGVEIEVEVQRSSKERSRKAMTFFNSMVLKRWVREGD